MFPNKQPEQPEQQQQGLRQQGALKRASDIANPLLTQVT